ncbi:C1q-like domain-containing protein [Paenibacillus ehimensis]|uniref:C1q-like domain-containing protein n=1 Tax=Paenibacillus ehimensis TaxID=79264 RepID=UPI000FDA205E|nr:hypothetical protein [Paenibacillus ehimensis]
MADLIGNPSKFHDRVEELTEDHDAVPETWNPTHQKFIDNDVHLKSKIENIISPSAVYFDMKDKFRAWQGVSTDGNFIYVVTDRNENFELENIISVYTMDGIFVSEKRNAYIGTDSSGRFMSFGDCSVIDGYLYVPVYNCNSGGPPPFESKVVQYSLPDLSQVSEVDIGSGVAECVTKHLDDFWVCYHDLAVVKRFNSNFTLKETYNLSQELGTEGGYQSLLWVDGFLYLNLHGSNNYGIAYAPGLDKYSFDGTNFTFVERIKPPTYGAGQGICKFGNNYYWNDRPGNKIIITNYLKRGNLLPLLSESRTVLLGDVGLGVEPRIVPVDGRRYLSIKGDSSLGVIELGSGAEDADIRPVGTIHYVDLNCTGVEKRIGNIAYYLQGTTPNNRGGQLRLALKMDNGDKLIDRFIIHSDGVMEVINQSSFRAYQSVAQSLAANTETKILFQTKDYDNQNEFDSTSSVFTAKRDGIYMISCGVGFDQPASNRVILTVRKNGQTYEMLADVTSTAAGHASFTGSTIVKLAAGDYLEVAIYSTNSVTCFNHSSRTFFSAIKIA